MVNTVQTHVALPQVTQRTVRQRGSSKCGVANRLPSLINPTLAPPTIFASGPLVSNSIPSSGLQIHGILRVDS